MGATEGTFMLELPCINEPRPEAQSSQPPLEPPAASIRSRIEPSRSIALRGRRVAPAEIQVSAFAKKPQRALHLHSTASDVVRSSVIGPMM